jgi:peroxiredoxin
MKKIIFLFSLFFALNVFAPDAEAQTTKAQSGFVITLTAENAGTEWVYLSRRKNGEMSDIDSAKATVIPIVLKGKQDVPEMLYLRITGSNSLVPVFTENSKITVSTDFDDPSKTKVEGSAVHKQYDMYNAGLSEITSVQEALVTEYRAAQKAEDAAKLTALEAKFNELDGQERAYNTNFVLQNKGSFVTPYVIRRAMFYTLELNELKNLIATLDKQVLKSVYSIDLQEKITVLEKVAVGKKYTDIILPGVDGPELKLSDFVGKNIILVDFWASWCGPCRGENPNVVKLYNDYHQKGFDIVGVSFDNDDKGWRDAIQSDGLTWHHMSDLKGWNSKAAELYGVASIPHTVLIGKDGTIIAKNLRGEELRAKLSELLD